MKLSSLPVALLSLAGLSAAAAAAVAASCPTEIHATIPHHIIPVMDPEPRRTQTLDEIHSTLESCANITTLDLEFTHVGCQEGPERWSLPFSPSGRTRYATAALESLSLSSYDLGDTEAKQISYLPVPWYEEQSTRLSARLPTWLRWWLVTDNTRRWLAWRLLPPAQRHKTNVELWVDAMDFSRVRNLSITDKARNGQTVAPDILATTLAPRLPSLRSLRVEGPEFRPLVVDAAPAGMLEVLSWISPGAAAYAQLEATLERQGARLAELEWRTPESLERVRPAIPTATLARLAELAPRLESLAIDVNRNGTTWPWDEFRALARGAPGTLRTVSLYLEMASECRRQNTNDGDYSWGVRRHRMDDENIDNNGTEAAAAAACTGLQQYAMPLLSEATSREVAEFLRANGIPALKQVNLYAGSWREPYRGSAFIESTLESERAWSRCQVPKGDGEIVCHGGYVGGWLFRGAPDANQDVARRW
ncbi:hypothetical protein CDEST_14801 [Colletotrichum destructivum]|uniref:Uncharacterized protein n=1 Tax=Colletotrichum destructivum TaxID=34406 RepID=A0AAX4J303_9PEZI|nr:hypothetical protein CDEST_14801 [Colletotrichum destructivum]